MWQKEKQQKIKERRERREMRKKERDRLGDEVTACLMTNFITS